MNLSTKTISPTFAIGGDLRVNRIGYGAMHLTGPGMWGPPEAFDAAVAILRHAVDQGVNFIDTADSYGPGYNERVIRDALHPYPEDLVIATKGGMLRTGPQDWSHTPGHVPYTVACGRPEYLRQQVELSLANLGREQIDLYQLHRIDPTVPMADQLGVLVDLQRQGKIRHIGISGQPEVSLGQLKQACAIAEVVAVEILYNIGDRGGEPILRYAEVNDIAFIPWFPLGHGDLLAPGSPLLTATPDCNASPAQLGLAWLLHHSPNIILIPGTTSIAHLEENLRTASVSLDTDEYNALAELCADSVPRRIS